MSFSDKLSSLLGSEKGAKLADRVQDLLSFLEKDSLTKLKRKNDGEEDPDPKKQTKEENGIQLAEAPPSLLTPTDVSDSTIDQLIVLFHSYSS